MPTELISLLVAIGVATMLVVGASSRILGGPYESLRRMLLPFLWVGSREWRTSFGQFALRSVFTRQAWLVAWTYTVLGVLVVTTVLWKLVISAG